MAEPLSKKPQSPQPDEFWMGQALELAKKGWGHTSPNPMVGCVVVKGGVLVGQGYHPKAGEPHAEVFALREAAEHAQGATLYVTLEPCNHHGRTPPCTEAILQAGIARVVGGMTDPNPKVRGTGYERLRQAGLEVTVGILEEACRQLNEGFIHWVQTGRPLGILKYAMTLDGKIALASGHSFWVTGPESRTEVHRLRAGYDAVIVGGQTVRQDNPQLTCRLYPGRNPLRVVLSQTLDLPLEAQIWNQAEAPTVVFTGIEHALEKAKALEAMGVEVIVQDPISPKTVIEALGKRGLCSALWECGGTLAAEAIREGQIQKVLAFIAPKIVGGLGSPGPVGELSFQQMTEALVLHQVRMQTFGSDFLIEGYLEAPPAPQFTLREVCG
jgi:diaminohydroxyphosphoribosylaminopyrimidine deaminase / 5-amino-6-(5-phosphoribosylamino)uracil reductase